MGLLIILVIVHLLTWLPVCLFVCLFTYSHAYATDRCYATHYLAPYYPPAPPHHTALHGATTHLTGLRSRTLMTSGCRLWCFIVYFRVICGDLTCGFLSGI